MPNVLFINPAWDAAGVSIQQSNAINKYTNWKSRHFRAVRTFGYETDITPENYNKDEFINLIKNADILHFCSATHDYNSPHNWGFNWNDLIKDKVKIFHDYNSFPGHWRERANAKDYWNKREQINYNAIFSSIPQAKMIYKDCVYIPDIVDEKLDKFKNSKPFDKIRLCHFPTGGGNNKNTTELNSGVNIAKANGINLEYIMKTGISNEEVINIKSKCNLAFDAIWRGFHGMTSVENVAMGIPTMCAIDEEFKQPFFEFFQTDKIPFDDVKNPNDIANVIRKYSNLEILKNRNNEVKDFSEKHWTAEYVVKNIIKEYEKL
jgi:hypothetical protein